MRIQNFSLTAYNYKENNIDGGGHFTILNQTNAKKHRTLASNDVADIDHVN